MCLIQHRQASSVPKTQPQAEVATKPFSSETALVANVQEVGDAEKAEAPLSDPIPH